MVGDMPQSRQEDERLSISNNGQSTVARSIVMTISDDRMTALEIRAAEQEHTIEELSSQIAEQWNVIERLQRKVDVLTQRFLALEEQSAPDTPVTRPPHW